jgi:hypothetical protein
VREDGYVDSGSFLGWVFVGDPNAPSDWVWSVSFNKYIFVQQSPAEPALAGWAYIPHG